MSGETSPAVAWVLGLLDAVGSGPTGKTVRQCPAHDDAHPSLSIGQGDDGHALIKCHAGCEWRAILAALTLPSRYLYEPPPVDPAAYAHAFVPPIAFPPLSARTGRSQQTRGYRLDAIHEYGPDHRVLRYRKGTKKEMHWETFRDGAWIPGLLGTPTSELPLYRQPDVRQGIAAGEAIALVESESSVDALRGWYATTWAGGASSVQIGRLTAVLGGYPNLIVIPDNDTAGLACLAVLTEHDLAPNVLLPAEGEDARDLHDRVGPDRFRELVNKSAPRPRHPPDKGKPPHRSSGRGQEHHGMRI